jgi:dihydroorotate dehydrogenase (fumarate)
MKLNTTYLGLKLSNPFMPGASPLADDLDTVLELEDAGASAIVMRSLFEEQVVSRKHDFSHLSRFESEADAKAASYFPMLDEFSLAPDTYLEQIRRIKGRVSIPVIASINGTTTERWLDYTQLVQKAGAAALELNFYHVATDAEEDSASVERRLLDVTAVLKETLTIPVAVKLSPFYSSLPNLAKRLQTIGVDGLVLFNRFYQPDIDPEELEATPIVALSSSADLLLRLRWLAILAPNFPASLAVSGGIHSPVDAVKAVMAGADAVQMVSALLQHGARYLTYVLLAFDRWGSDHGYTTIDEMRDRMSLVHCADAQAFERGSYLRVLHSWHR